MIKHINKEIKIELYCCDLCNKESRDLMSRCHKCKKHMCRECYNGYSSVLKIHGDMWYDLCKDCVKSISHLKKEQEELLERLWDIDDEVVKLIRGGAAS